MAKRDPIKVAVRGRLAFRGLKPRQQRVGPIDHVPGQSAASFLKIRVCRGAANRDAQLQPRTAIDDKLCPEPVDLAGKLIGASEDRRRRIHRVLQQWRARPTAIPDRPSPISDEAKGDAQVVPRSRIHPLVPSPSSIGGASGAPTPPTALVMCTAPTGLVTAIPPPAITGGNKSIS